MNTAFPDQIYNGICLCISFQLIAIGVYKTYAKEHRLIILGVLYAIIGSAFLNTLFYPTIKESTLLSIMIGGGKQIFYAPLIYLYFILLNPHSSSTNIFIKHLWFPLLFNLVYLIFKIFLPSIFYQPWFYLSSKFIDIVVLGFYVYLGFGLFNNTKLNQLKPELKKRYSIFYFGLLGYYLLTFSYLLIVNIYPNLQSVEAYFFRRKYFFTPLSIVVNTALLYFVLTETKQSKLLFKKPRTSVDKQKYDDFDIVSLIQQYFHKEKIFVNANLTIDHAAKTLQVPKNVLRQYLKEEFNTTFVQFINQLRIQEFKQRLLEEEYEVYSLTGIASMVGFQSKATFFRVFKQIEGMTPSEYQKEML